MLPVEQWRFLLYLVTAGFMGLAFLMGKIEAIRQW